MQSCEKFPIKYIEEIVCTNFCDGQTDMSKHMSPYVSIKFLCDGWLSGLWCFNNISVISWLSVLLVEETGVPWENHRPVASQ